MQGKYQADGIYCYNNTFSNLSLGRRQQHAEAIEVFEEASTFPQADTLLYFRLGNSLFHQEHLAAAENNFKHALQVSWVSKKASQET